MLSNTQLGYANKTIPPAYNEKIVKKFKIICLTCLFLIIK